jgi:ParB family transcriptional regulator, chromosome partitioning protein
MQLTTIALEALSISPANMRHNKRPPDIADILPSVRARGILVPLLVRPNGQPGHYEIIAGRRRYFAAKTIAEEADSSALVALPCAILDDSDDAAALEASLIENIARLDPDEIAQYETFSRLLREGRSIEQIALTFGISERQVKQRLAIGTLHPRLRKLYAADTIDSQTLQLLTLASKSQQAAWLKLLDDPEAYAPTGQRLKSWLMGGTAIPTSNALFKLADYPGTIITDLFGEDSYFGDSDLFWSLQTAVIEQRAQELRDAGWQSVVMLERGERFCSYDHVRHPKAKGGRAYLAIGHDGTLAEHLGYITQREARRIAKGAAAEDTPAVPKAKPEMTQAMANYLALHKQAAVRLELAHQPRMALRLLLLWLLTGSRNLNARPDPQQAHSPAIEASLAHNRAQTLFNDRRTERLAQLGISSDPGDSLTGCGTDIDRDTLFAQLCRMEECDIHLLLGTITAELLSPADPAIEIIGGVAQIGMSLYWKPDDCFFELLREKATINAMLAEVAGADVAAGNVKEPAKVQKAILQDCLEGRNGRSAADHWLPHWLQFGASNTPQPSSVDASETRLAA